MHMWRLRNGLETALQFSMNRSPQFTPGWTFIGIAIALFYGVAHVALIDPPAKAQPRTEPAYFSASGKLVRTGFNPAAR